MTTLFPKIGFQQNDDAFQWAIFRSRLAEYGYSFHQTDHWTTSVHADDLAVLPGVVFTHRDSNDTVQVVYDNRTGKYPYIAFLSLGDGSAFVEVGAHGPATAKDVLAVFREHLPEQESTSTDVPVRFWYESPHGPQVVSRMIQVSPWKEIEPNYTKHTAAELAKLMHGFQPAVGGQLMLWQGEPGTGKTHALRAIASEWRDWADLHYIVDPDNLFGRSAHYLIQVLLADQHDERWKILVLEDTGELLAADAKAQTGQALSRLLNVVDGLIGQGLRVLVLVTTNEELKTLHPAVARPGRCAAQVTFQPFMRDEANQWLAQRGHETQIQMNSVTLAQMYGRLGGAAEAELDRQRAVGFGA